MRLSILDLAPIVQGSGAADALRQSLTLARHAERLGYARFWLAEHHNMAGIASAATAVVIGHVAAGTTTIRVGSGGIMLPNHSPLVIAEQFGTLECLFPGRIDLGLGRAPGTDQPTMRALRRGQSQSDTFPQDVLELQAFLGDPQPGQTLHAVPGEGTHVPLWILGSSLYGAELAAVLGLPYAFASHFAPADLLPALRRYRAQFRPSAQCGQSYAMPAVSVVAAATDREAARLFTSAQMRFADMARGIRGPLKPPIDDIEAYWTPAEKMQASHMLSRAIVGSPATVSAGLAAFARDTGADEIIVATPVFDQSARLQSCEIVIDAGATISAPPSPTRLQAAAS